MVEVVGGVSVVLDVDDSAVEEALVKLRQIESGLSQVRCGVRGVELEVEGVAGEGGVKGLEAAGARVTRMLPGLREATVLQKSLGKLLEGDILGVVGAYGLIMHLLQRVVRVEEEQRRKQHELQRAVMQAQNFTNREQYTAWEVQQKTALTASRNIGR